jgi:hypothetical protein
MKISSLLSVSLIAAVLSGCSGIIKGTPKVTFSSPVLPPVYSYGQEPSKRIIADGGNQYRRHVREMQDMRLVHERAMTAMEYRAEEARYAREKGFSAPPVQAFSPQQTPQAVPQRQVFAPDQRYYGSPQPQRVVFTPPPPPPLTVPYTSVGYGAGGYYPSYGEGHYVQQRKLFGVRFNAAVNPTYGGGYYHRR